MNENTKGPIVILRAADAGDTWLYWRWLHQADSIEAGSIPRVQQDLALLRLTQAIPTPIGTENADDAIMRAAKGPLFNRESEEELAIELADAIFPRLLIQQIFALYERNIRPTIRITPSPSLASIPWETLAIARTLEGASVRLIEVALIELELPMVAIASRQRMKRAWLSSRQRPPLYAISPRNKALPDVLTAGTRRNISKRGLFQSGVASDPGVARNFTRFDLSRCLIDTPRSRFLYYGHVSAAINEPGAASIHLSDDLHTPGHTRNFGDSRPLSAYDLIAGTHGITSPTGDPIDTPKLGYDIWPMPPRVAVIACEGGADHRTQESFGLVTAFAHLGASLVTTTRWTLPTDAAMVQLGAQEVACTTTLAEAVDAAHNRPDMSDYSSRWVVGQLDAWRQTGEARYSPVLWGALAHYKTSYDTDQQPLRGDD